MSANAAPAGNVSTCVAQSALALSRLWRRGQGVVGREQLGAATKRDCGVDTRAPARTTAVAAATPVHTRTCVHHGGEGKMRMQQRQGALDLHGAVLVKAAEQHAVDRVGRVLERMQHRHQVGPLRPCRRHPLSTPGEGGARAHRAPDRCVPLRAQDGRLGAGVDWRNWAAPRRAGRPCGGAGSRCACAARTPARASAGPARPSPARDERGSRSRPPPPGGALSDRTPGAARASAARLAREHPAPNLRVLDVATRTCATFTLFGIVPSPSPRSTALHTSQKSDTEPVP